MTSAQCELNAANSSVEDIILFCFIFILLGQTTVKDCIFTKLNKSRDQYSKTPSHDSTPRAQN